MVRQISKRAVLTGVVMSAVLVAGCSDVAPPNAGGSPSVKPSPTADPSATLTPAQKPPQAAPVRRTFPARLKNGKPPLFIVVSFDGAGDLALWTHWRTVAKQVDARMTFFLSGTFVYPEAHRKDYKPPYKKPGASDVGFGDPAKVVPRAAVLRQAIAEGHEIGTHANGHFCGPTGIARWNAQMWDYELRAFDLMVNNGASLAAGKKLAAPFDPKSVKGMRTPCLEGNRAAYRQVMRKRGMLYDASDAGLIAWPKREQGLWDFPLQSIDLAGTGRTTLTMDYNLWFAQTKAKPAPLAHAPRLKGQVLATYRNALARSRGVGNPPLFLGNHFNRWNNSVYAEALTTFVKETCKQPDVRCVSNIELIHWLEKNGVPGQPAKPVKPTTPVNRPRR
ncbi:hypothetical protein [Kribbella deserti]|uniref:Polysaccharide deacetylase n=1 Tax=Kribbella deserti TaxID=1926257 RepID=A0ABV6QMN2_9ACTN